LAGGGLKQDHDVAQVAMRVDSARIDRTLNRIR
jgi:hypothetical protein